MSGETGWIGEVIADSSGKWVSNQICFATRQEALDYVFNLMDRWTLVTDVRVTQTDRPVSARWDATQAYPASLTLIKPEIAA